MQIYTYIKSSLGPKEPIIWEISLAITTISLPLGYSGVFKSNFQATDGEKMRDLSGSYYFFLCEIDNFCLIFSFLPMPIVLCPG